MQFVHLFDVKAENLTTKFLYKTTQHRNFVQYIRGSNLARSMTVLYGLVIISGAGTGRMLTLCKAGSLRDDSFMRCEAMRSDREKLAYWGNLPLPSSSDHQP